MRRIIEKGERCTLRGRELQNAKGGKKKGRSYVIDIEANVDSNEAVLFSRRA